MKWICNGEFYFLIEAKDQEEAIEKGWNFIYKKLPKVFNTEGTELWVETEESD